VGRNVLHVSFSFQSDEARIDIVDKWLQWVTSTLTVGEPVIQSKPALLIAKAITLGT